MITKAEIQSIDFTGNTCVVRMPLFESAAGGDRAIATATISNTPGSYNGYKEGDVVLVAFENGQLQTPCVIGKLYLGASEESKEARGSVNCEAIVSEKNNTLPLSTKIINDTPDLITKHSAESYKTVKDIIERKQDKLTAGNNITISYGGTGRDPDTLYIDATGGAGGNAVWGQITGTLSNQTDLQTQLNRIDTCEQDITALEQDKQDILTAGTGIAIDAVNNIISSTVEGIVEIDTQDIQIWDETSATKGLPVGLYKLTYNGTKNIFYWDDNHNHYVTVPHTPALLRISSRSATQAFWEVYTGQTCFSGFAMHSYGEAVNGFQTSPVHYINNYGSGKQRVWAPTDDNYGTAGQMLVSNGQAEPRWISANHYIQDISDETIRLWDLEPGIYKLTYNGEKKFDRRILAETSDIINAGNSQTFLLFVNKLTHSGNVRKSFKFSRTDWTKLAIIYGQEGEQYCSYINEVNDGSPIEYVNWSYTSNIWAPTANGSSGQVLQANGGNNAPTWTTLTHSYRHDIMLYDNATYFCCFSFINNNPVAYTTSAAISAALVALGFIYANGKFLGATGPYASSTYRAVAGAQGSNVWYLKGDNAWANGDWGSISDVVTQIC